MKFVDVAVLPSFCLRETPNGQHWALIECNYVARFGLLPLGADELKIGLISSTLRSCHRAETTKNILIQAHFNFSLQHRWVRVLKSLTHPRCLLLPMRPKTLGKMSVLYSPLFILLGRDNNFRNPKARRSWRGVIS